MIIFTLLEKYLSRMLKMEVAMATMKNTAWNLLPIVNSFLVKLV